MTIVDTKFQIGDIVYLVTDIDQLRRVVIAIELHPNDQIIYKVCLGVNNSEHYDFELSLEENTVTKVK